MFQENHHPGSSLQSPLATTREPATRAKSSPKHRSTCCAAWAKTSKVAASEAQCQDILEGNAAFKPSARKNDPVDPLDSVDPVDSVAVDPCASIDCSVGVFPGEN